MSEKKIDLIAQLLAKAESTTPEEAEALTEHAERLMVKYMIDQATLDARRVKAGKSAEKIVKLSVDVVGSYRKSLVNVWVMAGRALGAVEFLKSSDNGKFIKLHLIGFESDLEQLITLGKSLEVQGAVALRSWWKINKPHYSGVRSYDQWEARSAFLNGFATGVARRITDSKAKIVNGSSTSTALVLVDRSQAVQEFFQNIPQTKGRAQKEAWDHKASLSGFQAGKNANTGGRSVGQGRGISA